MTPAEGTPIRRSKIEESKRRPPVTRRDPVRLDASREPGETLAAQRRVARTTQQQPAVQHTLVVNPSRAHTVVSRVLGGPQPRHRGAGREQLHVRGQGQPAPASFANTTLPALSVHDPGGAAAPRLPQLSRAVPRFSFSAEIAFVAPMPESDRSVPGQIGCTAPAGAVAEMKTATTAAAGSRLILASKLSSRRMPLETSDFAQGSAGWTGWYKYPLMGKVVPLRRSPGPRGAARGRRGRGDKTALVLGGGGFTGGVYEIGALRAFDLLAVNRTVNEFDIYVGTSAGSFVASMVANGVTPEEMMRVLEQGAPFADRRTPTCARCCAQLPGLRPAGSRCCRCGSSEPSAIWPGTSARSRWSTSRRGSRRACRPGSTTTAGIERYIREVLSDPDRTNDFRELGSELRIIATDLDTCERIVFGEGEWDDVPISRAVAASGALPIVYEPYRAARPPSR